MLKKALCQVRYWFFSKWLWIVEESIQLAQKAYVNLPPINWKGRETLMICYVFLSVMLCICLL